MSYKKFSFDIKILVTLTFLGIFILSTLFIYIIPKMEEQQFNHEISQLEQMVDLTKSNIELFIKFVNISKEIENEKLKDEFKNSLEILYHRIEHNEDLNSKDIQNIIQKEFQNRPCYVEFNEEILHTHKSPLFNEIKTSKESQWIKEKLDVPMNMCPHTSYKAVYQKSFNSLGVAKISCSLDRSKKHNKIEKRVKEIIHKGFSATKDLHKGKIYLIWINKNIERELSLSLIKNSGNNNYCLSKISGVKTPQTGELSARDIFNYADKSYVEHKLKGENAFTWINSIYENEESRFFLILTANEKDLVKNKDSIIKSLLPIAIIVLLIAVVTAYFIFKKFFKEIKDLDSQVEERTKELSNSLSEKEILLKEIHHRVKNNLAMTINFIKLQKYKVEDESVQDVLSDIENRVYAMELLHRKLYEKRDLNSVDFKSYVEDLVGSIVLNYQNYQDVAVSFTIDNYSMNIDYSMPCGLIINEIVTNSFKYAFKESRGVLDIRFKVEDKKAVLKIRDNGEGLPKDFDITEDESLGLRFIYTIATTQLDGSCEYNYCDGACFTIEFKV